MAAVQAEALRLGCWLLILDTDPGSPAERFYRRQGWHRAGEIPDYAAAPDGRLLPTVLFYKNLLGPEAA